MKTFVYLIILGFTQFQCILTNLYINETKYNSFATCPLTHLRRKRAQVEYTRWQANLESTPEEFIVKILDEDLTTSKIKPIVAVNIMPATKRQDKIIVGGPIIPAPTLKIQEKELTKDDYTRFIPPTTGAVSKRNEEIFLASISPARIIDNVLHLKSKGLSGTVRYNLQRDDSTPASPQFLQRAPMLLARQYAPITQVAFTKLTTFSPVLHTNQELSIPTKTTLKPIRTTSGVLKFYPTRAISNEGRKFNFYEDEEEIHTTTNKILTRSTFIPRETPLRTSAAKPEVKSEDIYGLPVLENKLDEIDNIDNRTKTENKDSEIMYNSIFYNDDDNEVDKKKTLQGSIDSYMDNNSSADDALQDIESTSKIKGILSSEHFSDGLENKITAVEHNYLEDYEINTENNSSTTIKDEAKLDHNISKPHKENARRHPVCNLLKLRQLNFNSPRTLSEIVSQLRQWAEESPLAKWIDITGGNYTTMENPIHVLIVDDPSSGQVVSAKQTVMIVAGIQGRDHHAVAAAMYVLYQLIERSEAHVDLLTKYRFWIIPVFNPDGYDYSMTFPYRRSWTKNLRQSWDTCKGRESCYACENYGLRCTVQPCYGVHLDRNFEYQWIPAEELQSEHPCGDLYAGTRQLSEPETRAFTHFLHEQKTSLYTFIAFKEGDILGIMYPYSHTRKKRAFDNVYRQRASRAASAAYSISGRPYVAGQTSEFLPLYAGGIEDWVDGHLGIDNTYTIMMFRHTDAYNTKLITERVVHEAYAAMDTLLLHSTEPLGPPVVTVSRTRSSATLHCLNSRVLTVLTISFIYMQHIFFFIV